MSAAREFKDFIAQGNVVDLAVGVIIGSAFGKIVGSLVDQVIMPPIGLLTGGVDFSELKLVLQNANAASDQAEIAIQYGAFLTRSSSSRSWPSSSLCWSRQSTE